MRCSTYVTDKDSFEAPNGLAMMGQYDNCQVKTFDKPITITYVPCVSQAFNTLGGASSGHGPKSNQWIDCSYGDVPHLGHKAWIDLFNTSYGDKFKVDVRVKIWFECKNTR